ncbi:MAG: prepilin-type N-terminal cleavage/methylation domain-containing protein [Gloeomargarita sp. GMQP_bins_44]
MLLARPFQTPNDGFSLIEVVVATAIIGITAALIPPIVTLSVAARAQNQRVEQANLVAQGYIDLIRLRMERGLAGRTLAEFINDLDRLAPIHGAASLDAVPPPSASALRNADLCILEGDLRSPDRTQLRRAPCRLDINNDGRPDFGIQAFRIRQQTAPNGRPLAFLFGVRVYSRAVVQGTYTGPLGTQPASIRLGASESLSNPLAVQYGRVFMPDSPDSLGAICLSLGGSVTRCSP